MGDGIAQHTTTGEVTSYTIDHRLVSLPVEVRDATSMTAMFIVPSAAVRRLIPSPDLQVPELFPGRTLCVITAVEYHDNDLGRYNEVSVAFFVRQGRTPLTPFFGILSGFRRGEIGAYIHRLPVTTDFSCVAGRDIWGFPKTVDDIEFTDDGGRRTCRWSASDQHVLSLTVRRGGSGRMTERPQDAYAWRDGVLRKTPSVMGGTGAGMRFRGVSLTLGAHPIAGELRTLGLPKRALMSTWIEHMQARFGAPQVL